jgi:hypothetical protein
MRHHVRYVGREQTGRTTPLLVAARIGFNACRILVSALPFGCDPTPPLGDVDAGADVGASPMDAAASDLRGDASLSSDAFSDDASTADDAFSTDFSLDATSELSLDSSIDASLDSEIDVSAPDDSESGDIVADREVPRDTPTDGGGLGRGPICSPHSWCWEDPLPMPGISQVWGPSPDSVWAVGAGIAHWDGHAWGPSTMTPTQPGYECSGSLRGTGPDDIWFQTNLLYHWDGNAWTMTPIPTTPAAALNSPVFPRAPNDAWTSTRSRVGVQIYSTLVHWDGMTWSNIYTQPSSYGWSVWPIANNDAWASGANVGNLYHWDGATWNAVPRPTPFMGSPGELWGAAPNDGWSANSSASGSNDDLAHWDGTQWTQFKATNVTGTIVGTATNDLWTESGAHWDGVSWSSTPAAGKSQVAFPNDVWFATGNVRDSLARYDGTSVKPMTVNLTTDTLNAVAACSSTDVWAVGNAGTVVHSDGTQWTKPSSGVSFDLQAVWCAGPNDLWAGGTGGFLHWNGTTWTPTVHRAVTDFWGVSPTDLYAIAGGVLVRWDGTAWNDVQVAIPGPMISVSGTATDDIWIAGAALGHFDGTSWTSVRNGQFSKLFAIDRSHLYGIETDNNPIPPQLNLVYWDGTNWTSPTWVPEGGGPPQQVTGLTVWGSAPDDVWVPHSGAGFLHFDGMVWTESRVCTALQVGWRDVVGVGRNEQWGVGTGIVHRKP